MHCMHKVGLEPYTSIFIVQSLTIMLSHHEWYTNRFNIDNTYSHAFFVGKKKLLVHI